MSLELTTRQHEFLAAVESFGAENGYPPTLAEIAELLECTKQMASIRRNQLLAKGAVTFESGKARTIRVVKQEASE